MNLTNPNTPVSQQDLQDFYHRILPYLGGSSGGGGGHTIKDNGVAMDARSSLNLIGFDVTDNSSDDETDVEAHRLTSSEMEEIFETLPGAPTNLPRYSTNEQVVGYWIDGKPIYQKTLRHTFTSASISLSAYNIDTYLGTYFVVVNVDNNYISAFTSYANYAIYYSKTEKALKHDTFPSHLNNRQGYLTIWYTKTTDVAP